MIVKCPDCDQLYVVDDPEDEARHAKHHEEVTAPDSPLPNPVFASMADPESGMVIFNASAQDFLHNTLYRISQRFKREMKYDQNDWAPNGHQTEPGAIGVLFCDQDGRTLGGAGIYTNTPYKDISHMIGWVWIAPMYRRNGVFSRALPGLARRYPGALINFPYSEAMERFAKASPYIIRGSGPMHLIG